MTVDMLNDFVDQGYLDHSVVDGYDPYYEPAWTGDDSWKDHNASDELDAYYDCRQGW